MDRLRSVKLSLYYAIHTNVIQNCFTWKEEVVCCCGLWDSHYIHVCVFWVLIPRGLGLTGMFYLVSLYLIVCHLCDVTDIASSDDSQH